MSEQQHPTSDNRHQVAIWCRADVFTFGALTTPPPPEITPAVSFTEIFNYLSTIDVCLESQIYC
jgi:hypothetical protein